MDDPNSVTELINPTTITGAVAAVIIAITSGIFGLLNRRAASNDRGQPTMAEVWQRMDDLDAKNERLEVLLSTEQRARRKVENKLSKVLRIIDAYARRVVASGGPELTEEEQHEIDDTAGFLE
jgi:hypothetical protein